MLYILCVSSVLFIDIHNNILIILYINKNITLNWILLKIKFDFSSITIFANRVIYENVSIHFFNSKSSTMFSNQFKIYINSIDIS